MQRHFVGGTNPPSDEVLYFTWKYGAVSRTRYVLQAVSRIVHGLSCLQSGRMIGRSIRARHRQPGGNKCRHNGALSTVRSARTRSRFRSGLKYGRSCRYLQQAPLSATSFTVDRVYLSKDQKLRRARPDGRTGSNFAQPWTRLNAKLNATSIAMLLPKAGRRCMCWSRP